MSGKKCESCTWRSYMPATVGGRAICAYLQITGHSRLKDVYKRLGVDHMTDAVREAMRPENCRMYRKGKVQRLPEVDMLLPGSSPRKREAGETPSVTASRGIGGDTSPRGGGKSGGEGGPLPSPGATPSVSYADSSTGGGAKGDSSTRGGGKRGGSKPKVNEARALQLYRQGKNDVEIGRELGMCETTVGAWRRRMGLAVNRHVYAPRGDQMALLYRQGMTDAQIAEEMAVKAKSVARWRSKTGLAPNPGAAQKARMERDSRMMKLYRQGLADAQIAEEMGTDAHAVACWRGRRQLLSNADRRSDWDKAKARALHGQGARDTEIAAAVGMSVYTVQQWRQREGLHANRGKAGGYSKTTWEAEGKRLYDEGLNDFEIAQKVGRTVSAVARWRKLRGLPAQSKRKRKT